MERGGAQMRTLDVMGHVDRRRYEMHFGVLSGRADVLDDRVRELGGQMHMLPLKSVRFPREFRRLLDRHRFDVVHCHAHYTSGWIVRLAARAGVPIRVVHFRSSHDGRGNGPSRRLFRRVLRRWIDRYATDVLAVSQWAMANAWSPEWRSDPRCRVIYNGLEPSLLAGDPDPSGVRREFGIPEDAPLYVHVGRMTEAKNHLRLLSIFADVLKRRPAARLLLVGRGGNRVQREVRNRIAALGLADRVFLAGQRADVPRLLEAADAMIFPSLWEGLPGAVLEACAAGTPVLASAVPGICEIAARLPEVRCLSLDASDRRWAGAVDEIPAYHLRCPQRRAAFERFARSEFVVSRCAEQLCRVWQGEGRPRNNFPVCEGGVGRGTVPFSVRENRDRPQGQLGQPPSWGAGSNG